MYLLEDRNQRTDIHNITYISIRNILIHIKLKNPVQFIETKQKTNTMMEYLTSVAL